MEYFIHLLHVGPVFIAILTLFSGLILKNVFYISRKKIENYALLWISIGMASASNFYKFYDNSYFIEPALLYAAVILNIVLSNKRGKFSALVSKPVKQEAHVVFFNRTSRK